MTKNWKFFDGVLLAAFAVLFSAQAIAVSFNDDFTQANDGLSRWIPQTNANGYPCLTAGTATNNTTANSSIAGCNYTTPNAAGSGALRFTPANTYERSAMISSDVFSTTQGLDVTYTTYTYGGDSGGAAQDGADGMTFFMSDGALQPQVDGVYNLGGSGGSLAYGCSNTNTISDGIEGAYLGLGMDEYGNFLNNNDNAATGIPAQTASLAANPNLSFNPWGNGNYQPNRIGLRGAGNVRWHWLNTNYPGFYPSTLTASQKVSAVQNTCRTGRLWSYANAVVNNITAMAVNGTTLTATVASHGYVNGDTVSIGGTATATPVTQNISSLTNGGANGIVTIAVPSVSGYSNGQAVTLGGGIAATQSITSINNYTAGPPKSLRVRPSSISGYSVGQSVIISGVTGTDSTKVSGTFVIQSIGLNYFVINLPTGSSLTGNPTVVLTSAKITTVISGAYTISNLNTAANTFEITLPYTPQSAVISSSPTVTGATPIVPDNYTIRNVTTNTFDVTLNARAATVNNVSGNATNTSQNGAPGAPVQQTTTVKDYAAIAGGFWVLPATNLIANEAATTIGAAWPITYKLRITPGGLLTYQYSYNGGAFQPVLSNFNITAANGAMPANVRFGFSAATGGSTNVHELACFVAEPILSSSSASGNVIQGQQVKTSTNVFLASYDPGDWSGSVAAYSIINTAGTLTIATTPDWDTNCVLTGGSCLPSGGTLQTPSNRNIITWSGTAGIPFQWTSLTSAQQTVLQSTDNNGQLRLNWLRGDRTQEQTTTSAGALRARSGVLGDIVNSSPTWVGPPSQKYGTAFKDALYSAAVIPENATSAQSYQTFATNNATRTQIVYTGSNDGMLHGSRAGADNTDGTFNETINDGREVLAFVPSTALANNDVVNLTSSLYSHKYFVDAAPGYGDLFYGNAWHTWLVGGLGAGGAEIYALDVTNPTNFVEASAATLVKGDWTPAAIAACTKFTGACGTANMGYSYGTPIIRRLHNGQWAIIFANGIGSTNNSAGVFVGLVNSSTGAISSFVWLDTFKNGTVSNPNGISYISSADLEGDRITDYLYGGDLQGNVWRFDLTSSNVADWSVTDYSNPLDSPGTVRTNPAPLFTATNSTGVVQPITTRMSVSENLSAGVQRVLLGFATGQTTPITNSSGVTYKSGTQTVYGVWDWNLNNWNAGVTTFGAVTIPASPIALASISTVPVTSPVNKPLSRALLSSTNSLLTQTSTSRFLKQNTVCWQGSTACGTTNNQYGWKFDLPDTTTSGTTTGYEQVIYNPNFFAGQLLLNTTTPPASSVAGQCKPVLPTGWTMAFNIESGGATLNNAGNVVNVIGNTSAVPTSNGSSVGIQLGGVGSPFVVAVGSKNYIVTQTASGTSTLNEFNPQGGIKTKRISWEQLR